MDWQFNLLKQLSLSHGASRKGVSNMPIEASIDIKKSHLNFSLKKFYRPTINNISDVANQLLWLADPLTFNDPQDCRLGIDDNLEIYALDKFVEGSEEFSDNEKRQIYKAKRRNLTIYHPSVWPILQINNRLEEFYEYLRPLTSKINTFIDDMTSKKYRVACFVQDYGKPYEYDNLMWAHYAQDFQGFCVEYDIERLFDYEFEDYVVCDWNSKTGFLNGCIDKNTLKQIIVNGLFPVHYSSKPQIITSGNAYKIGVDKINKKVREESEYNLLKSLITKHLIWKYEREWRLIISDDMIKSVGYKIPFPFVKRIIPGDGASRELKSILKLIENRLSLNNKLY